MGEDISKLYVTTGIFSMKEGFAEGFLAALFLLSSFGILVGKTLQGKNSCVFSSVVWCHRLTKFRQIYDDSKQPQENCQHSLHEYSLAKVRQISHM